MADIDASTSSLESEASTLERLEAPTPTLRVAPYDHDAVEALRSELGLSRAMASVMASRGFRDPESARSFLEPGSFPAPMEMGQRAAAEVLAECISSGATIAVHGDYDCDGVCSTALLARGLRKLGAKVIPRVPERSDGYGLSRLAIDELAASGAAALVAVDCGITAVEEIAHANSLGMVSIVVDHHRPRMDGTLPQASIVHPNLADRDAVPMCAAAVAGILIEELASVLDLPLDGVGVHELQALATVTDLMPLEGINRAIVIRGLKSLASTDVKGLAALIDGVGLDRSRITSRTLGFAIGPRINAAGRVRAAGAALELLLTDELQRAEVLAAELEAANIERRGIQQETTFAAERMAVEMADRRGWVLASPDWHKGVVGIVAGNLAGRFHRPTVVLAVEGEHATGSARSVPGFNVAAAIDACSHLLERHGGHSAAAGVTLKVEHIVEFGELFAQVVERTLPDELRSPSIVADAVVTPTEMTLSLAEELERLEPVGEGNRAPLLSMPNVRCTDLRRMGEGRHGRFRIENATGSCSAVAFNIADRVEVSWGERCSVVGRLEVNRFNGAEEPRVVAERVMAVEETDGDDRNRVPWLEEVKLHVEDLYLQPHVAADQMDLLPDELSSVLGSVAHGDVAAVLQSFRTAGSVVALTADAERRSAVLDDLAPGVSVVSWNSVLVAPDLLADAERIVMIDPPASPRHLGTALAVAEGRLHRVWGPAQLRFALKALEHELEIEPRIRPFYAALRAAVGGESETVLTALRGVERHPRPPRQVARMLCVLREIGALELDLESLAVTIKDPCMRLDESAHLVSYGLELTTGMAFIESIDNLASGTA